MQNRQQSRGDNRSNINTARTMILDIPSIIIKMISKTSSGVFYSPTASATIAKIKSVKPVNLAKPSNLSSPLY
jgi:hypothetical protein